MDWNQIDWRRMERLREKFLSGAAAEGPYWRDEEDLAHYDFSYAQRIGWKWDAVVRELKLRGWAPRPGTLLDWGCGSGIAHRRVLHGFGADRFDTLLLWDHSPAALSYSQDAAGKAFPSLNVCQATPGFLQGASPLGLLVISHVLNELDTADLEELRKLILRAEAVLWVEPGTHTVARGLQTIRQQLLSEFRVVAPCPHNGPCGILAEGRERDWCHFFAAPPAGIYADSNWVKFAQRAGIDLRSLPYSFLALERRHAETPKDGSTPSQADEPPLARVIGRPEHFKPYARVLSCEHDRVVSREISKRLQPALYKELERNKDPLLYRWPAEGADIKE